MKTTTKNPNTPKSKQKWGRYKFPSRPEIFSLFAVWMAYPPSARNPKTQGAFAKLHEISPDSLSDYKKKPEFWEKVEENKEKLKSQIEDNLLLAKAVFKDIE